MDFNSELGKFLSAQIFPSYDAKGNYCEVSSKLSAFLVERKAKTYFAQNTEAACKKNIIFHTLHTSIYIQYITNEMLNNLF